MISWTIECSVKEKIVVKEVFTNEKEAKDEFACICFENKISHENPGPAWPSTTPSNYISKTPSPVRYSKGK